MYNYPPALSTPPAINSYGGEVKSIEEVRTARVDPCGSLTFFLSPTEHKIYVKYIDLSGKLNMVGSVFWHSLLYLY